MVFIGMALAYLISNSFFTRESSVDYPTPAKTLRLCLFYICIVFIIFSVFDQVLDFEWVFNVESIILRSRFLSFFSGALLVAFIKSNTRLQHWLKRLAFSAIGDAEHAPWVLQSGLALISLVILIVLVKPDLFDKFESIKAGEVEARFNNAAPLSANTLNTIDIGSADLFRGNQFDDWADFAPTYAQAKKGVDDGCDHVYDKVGFGSDKIGRGAARQAVVKYLSSKDSVDLSKSRLTTACIFLKYMTPVVAAVKCLRLAGDLDEIRRSMYFSRMIYAAQNFVLDPDTNSWSLARAFSDAISLNTVINARCAQELPAEQSALTDARRIAAIVQGHNQRLDPYIVNFVGDALAFSVDTEAEAEFLNFTTNRYTTDHPGLVSLYFALSETKLRSIADWPLEEILHDLDLGYDLNNFILENARQGSLDADASLVKDIISDYDNNKASFLSEYLQTFIQISLTGIDLDQSRRADWARSFEKLQSIVNALEGESRISLDDYPRPVFSDAEVTEWNKAKIKAADLFDYATNIALSAVLLTQESGKSSAQPCAVARYYMSIANGEIESAAEQFASESTENQATPSNSQTLYISNKSRVSTKETTSSWTTGGYSSQHSEADENPRMKGTYVSRLKAYLLSVQHRVDASCN